MSIKYKLVQFLDLLTFHSLKVPYWIEIKTENPTCTYYFGHFNHPLAAKLMQQGYIQDLIEEEAVVTSIKLKRCHPEKLTVIESDVESEFQSNCHGSQNYD